MERVRAQMSAGAVCERAARGKRRGGCVEVLEAVRGRFEIPRSDAGSRPRASRFRGAGACLAVACEISRVGARTVTRKSSLWHEKLVFVAQGVKIAPKMNFFMSFFEKRAKKMYREQNSRYIQKC